VFKEKNNNAKMESKEDKLTHPILSRINDDPSLAEEWLRSSVT